MFERCDCQLSRLNAASASSPYTSISAPLACSIVAREAMALRRPVATSRDLARACDSVTSMR